MKGGSGPIVPRLTAMEQNRVLMMMKKVMLATMATLILSTSVCFASLNVRTVSSSDFNNYIRSAKFAAFSRSGSGYTMYEPSSPSAAQSEFRSLPGGRHDMYTGNIAVRDYLEEYGWYDDRKSISGGWVFTAWEKR